MPESEPKPGHIEGDGLDIKLRNTGDTVAVVRAIRLHIERVEQLKPCDLIGGDELLVSKIYDVELSGGPGATIEQPMSQEIRAGEADRFVVTVGTKFERQTLGGGDSAVYLLSGELLVNGEEELPLPRRLVVASPWPFGDHYFYDTGDSECERANIEALDRLLRMNAVHSSELEQVPEANPEIRDRTVQCGTLPDRFGADVEVSFVSENLDVDCGEVIDVAWQSLRESPLPDQRIGAWTCRRVLFPGYEPDESCDSPAGLILFRTGS
jgi:hypothetical protein